MTLGKGTKILFVFAVFLLLTSSTRAGKIDDLKKQIDERNDQIAEIEEAVNVAAFNHQNWDHENLV